MKTKRASLTTKMGECNLLWGKSFKAKLLEGLLIDGSKEKKKLEQEKVRIATSSRY